MLLVNEAGLLQTIKMITGDVYKMSLLFRLAMLAVAFSALTSECGALQLRRAIENRVTSP